MLIKGLDAMSDDACYRAMDWLLEISGAQEKEIFERVSDLMGLELDLLFFTTSTYFITEDADAPVPRDERGTAVPGGTPPTGRRGAQDGGFRTWGKSQRQ